ncbi:MAG: MFS transporter, partial [Acetivibrio sp.]
MNNRKQNIRAWRRLDNTAKLFPVISSENLTNVFRISCTLDSKIEKERLQQALAEVLPWFEGINVRLRRGLFWYYFEAKKKVPEIVKEATYPCKYLNPHDPGHFLFRVSYYENRINLEVFHAITDGMGAINFLKELTYMYLRLKRGETNLIPSTDCILGVEDSYVKHYKKRKNRTYPTEKAFRIKGDSLYLDTISIIHGYLDMSALKAKCKEYQVSITKYMVAL